MPKTTTAPITQSITNFGVSIVNGTGFIATNGSLNAPANTLLLTTAGAEGSIVKSMIIASDSSAASTIQFWISQDSGTTKRLLFTVVVAALSGQATLVNIDVLGNSLVVGLSLDQMGRPVLQLAPNVQIYVGILTTAVVSGRTVYVTGSQEDF